MIKVKVQKCSLCGVKPEGNFMVSHLKEEHNMTLMQAMDFAEKMRKGVVK